MAKFDKYDAANDQLNRVLGFFPRVDAKASVILSINIGMLALLAVNAPAWREFQWPMLIAALPLVLIGISLVQLYLNAFPQLDGGHDSMVYFREIAKKTEVKYVEEFVKLGEDEYLKDLLSQTWRNSEILKKKFDHVRMAFVFLAWGIAPWLVSLAVFVAYAPQTKSLLAK